MTEDSIWNKVAIPYGIKSSFHMELGCYFIWNKVVISYGFIPSFQWNGDFISME